ncbi:MAG TPA: helix-hairpin-helix domain-containing protein [Verrucomicrobiae bacterium]
MSHQKNFRGGFALIIVMLAIFVLATLAATLSISMKVETRLATTANDDQKMIWLARSAAEHACYGLAMEARIPNEQYRSLNQWWATGEAGPNETNSMLESFPQSWHFVDGSAFTYSITDLERYANINVAPTPVLQQALTVMGVDADDMSIISDSIQDWVQPGDSPRIAGAKNDYYQSLNPPYNCKEGPIDDMSELLLVRGISEHPEIFFGGSPSNVPPSPFQHQLGFANSADQGAPPDYPFGLTNVFTPFSSGQININTADAYVLQIIPGVDGSMATNIIQYRQGENNDSDDPSFKNVGQIQAAGVSPAVAAQIGRYCSVMSYTFRVDITATIGPDTRTFHAIIFQRGANVDIVNFYQDK